MKKIDIGQIVGILANFGVIAGIVFLVLETRQNNELLEMESRRTFTDRTIETSRFLVENPQILELAFKDEASLTPVEARQIDFMRMSVWLSWQEQFEEIRARRLDSRQLIPSWRTIFWGPNNWGMPLHWEAYKPRATAEFVQFVDEYVVTPGPPK